MKNYLVIVKWNDPYPKEFRYVVPGSSIAVATAKAVRQFRTEQYGRRIKQLGITISQL